MAARLQPAPLRPAEIVDLRRLSARNMDFDKSADLVRRFVELRALSGYALLEGGELAGYLYYVLEDGKGLIGDLYVRDAWRSVEAENRLIEAGLAAIVANRSVRRIESQLMMVRHTPGRLIPRAESLSSYERNFMRIDLTSAALDEGRVRRPIYIERWSDHYQDAAAQLIASAYTGHVDSRINDQYRSAPGARRFLYNIVQYPGCGAFYRPASYAAFDGPTGRLCGISLASVVAPECGHITQICVSPSVRGTGVGHALLRQSLTVLRDMGCRSASLTVTAANSDAVELYRRVGFDIARQFSAYVWEGW
jgi:ribosomal protein S18 acetylase RimI-like enzyme